MAAPAAEEAPRARRQCRAGAVGAAGRAPPSVLVPVFRRLLGARLLLVHQSDLDTFVESIVHLVVLSRAGVVRATGSCRPCSSSAAQPSYPTSATGSSNHPSASGSYTAYS